MQHSGLVPDHPVLQLPEITDGIVHWNLPPEDLAAHSMEKGQAVLTSSGAIAVDTGQFKGRAPLDRFIVRDDVSAKDVWWGDINVEFDAAWFDKLLGKVGHYLNGHEIYVRDAYVCASPEYREKIRVITEHPWTNLFAHNMFLRPDKDALKTFSPGWLIVNAPDFRSEPSKDGTRQPNFSIINLSRKIILIGGTGYTGEIKKAVFSALNFVLPKFRNVLPMHCAANAGPSGDVALFFGLSGTGKTTLSADPERKLIGDDEHGWTPDHRIFNFEGGCYAKVARLTQEQEPDIFNAVRPGALLENVSFSKGSNEVNYDDTSLTENARVSYPIEHIDNRLAPSVGGKPANIFFLAFDAFGVLPAISRLSPDLAAYHFMTGYTAKVAGTETGIADPVVTFSACFGAPFMPLHPMIYAEMFERNVQEVNARVWLVNTGCYGGTYGVGKRISLSNTRALIRAALSGALDHVAFRKEPFFGVDVPLSCPGVPSEILDPEGLWPDKSAYKQRATYLADAMRRNYESLWDLSDAPGTGEMKIALT